MAMKVNSDPFGANVSLMEPLEVLVMDFERVGINDPTEGVVEYVVFDKSAAKASEESERKKFQNEKAQNSVGPHRNFRRSFVPRANTLNNQWVGGFQHPRPNQYFGWKPNVYQRNFQNPNQIRNGNYGKPHFIGKFSRDTPMTKTQWRRYQRIQKAEKNVPFQPKKQSVQNGKQVDEKQIPQVEEADSNMVTDSFELGFPDDLEAICGVVSILHAEFAQQTLEEQEEEYFEDPGFDYGSGPSK
ncbi:hypothetical protein SESBI_23297, partial [Sesbania bispinosa]